MADLQYLIEREREEELRVSTRELSFPDDTSERIETYRLIWQWYDRLCACPYTFNTDEIAKMIQRCAAHENLNTTEALTRVVGVLVGRLDRDGIDVTDDTLQLDLVRQQLAKWDARRGRRHSDSG